MKKRIILIFLCFYFACANAQVDIKINVKNGLTNQNSDSVEVVLNNAKTGFTKVLKTNKLGMVSFNGIPISDTYEIKIDETDNYYASKIEKIDLRSNFSPSFSIFLTSKTTKQIGEVEVIGNSTTKINSVNAEVSSTLSAKEIETLPIEGRDITRALYRLPNVTQATGFFPEAPNVSINSANALYANYLIDGMDNNQQFLGGQRFAVPVGFVKNITVLTNNYSTEFGLTGNGIFNITSKSGSNDVTGEVFYSTRPGPGIDGKSIYNQKDLSGNDVKNGFQRQQFGFAVGGALKKDKTFYFLNAEQIIDFKDNALVSPDLGISETVKGRNQFTYLSGKIDHNWSQNFRSSVRLNGGIVNIERQGGGLEGGIVFPSAGNKQDRNSFTIANKNIYTKGNFKSETNYQFATFRWDYARPNNPNSPQVEVLNPAGNAIAVLGHPGFVFDTREYTQQIQQKFTFYAEKHTIKFGVELLSSDHLLSGGGAPNGFYRVQLDSNQLNDVKNANRGSDLGINDIPSDANVLAYSTELRTRSFGKRQNIYSAYVEDLFAVTNKLNITLGLRYDYDNLSVGAAKQGDFNNIAPRLSLNYKIKDNLSIRGGAGLFYEKVLYAIYSDALQQNTTSPDYKKQLQSLIDKGVLPQSTDLNAANFDGNLSAGASNVAYLNGPKAETLLNQRDQAFSNERRILNPNGYANPYTAQYSVGLQYQLDEDKLFYVDAVHNRGYNVARLVDLNSAARYVVDPNNVTVRTQAEADLTRNVPIRTDASGSYAIINGDTTRGVARSITMTDMGGESRYYALSMNFIKERGKNKYGYRFSYTLSQLTNNTEDINFRAMDANNFKNEWGPSINDRTHVLNAIFYYYPIKNLGINTTALVQSGQPINRIPNGVLYGGTTDLNGDGRSFGASYVGNSDRQPGETRNNDRLPWSVVFDIGVQYTIRFKKESTSGIELRADVFNLFDVQNLSGYANNATQSNQIQAGTVASGSLVRRNAGPPRQFQFTARYLF